MDEEDEIIRSSVGVVGAGIQGVCISLFLVKKGFKVTLIDRDEPVKNSASYGNAGHFSPYASTPMNRPDILVDVPSMLLSKNGPLALKWNYVPKMIPWFFKFIKNCSNKNMMHTAKYMHQILDLALPAYDELFKEIDISGLVENKVAFDNGFVPLRKGLLILLDWVALDTLVSFIAFGISLLTQRKPTSSPG